MIAKMSVFRKSKSEEDIRLRKKSLISKLTSGGAMCMVSILSAAAGVMALPMLANAETAGDSLGGG